MPKIHPASPLRIRRLALGLSQDELAALVGSNGTDVSLIERGRIDRPDLAAKLRAALANLERQSRRAHSAAR